MSRIKFFLWSGRWTGSGCTMRTDAFINDVQAFINGAKSHKPKGFLCCSCFDCKNQKEHSSTGPIRSQLLQRGFMPNYICWTKHGKEGIIQEDDDEEDGDNDGPDVAEYGSNPDTLDDFVEDDLDQMMCDAEGEINDEIRWHKF